MIFTEGELAYLASQRLGRLATAQPNGTLQANPVGFEYNAQLQTIDIGGRDMGNSQKYRNVGANGHVAFVVDDIVSTSPWQVRFLEIRGHAEAVGNPDPPGRFAGPLIRIHPRRIISWGVDPDQPEFSKRTVRQASDG
jgi:pyridoxamine 5'-phosphate oxidase family protein